MPQFRARSKWVTRRMRWGHAKAGRVLTGIEKGMGLAKGARQVVLGDVLVVDARREPIEVIDQRDVVLEGFPDWSVEEFVRMFCKLNSCTPAELCTRIEYRYVLDLVTALGLLDRHMQSSRTRIAATTLLQPAEGLLGCDGPAALEHDLEFVTAVDMATVLRRADVIFETGPNAAREWGLVVAALTGDRVQLFGSPRPRPVQLELESRGAP
jgi:hypothetical protein